MDAKSEITKKRRRQIFEASVNVIGKKGFHSATIEEIACEAELGKGTIYQYIRKKEDLIALIAEEGISMMSDRLMAITSSDDTAEQRLQKIIYVMLDLIGEHSALARTMALELDNESAFDIVSIERKYLKKIHGLVRTAVEDMLPVHRFGRKEYAVIADVVISACFLWAHSKLLNRHAGDIDTYKNILADLFIAGLNREEKDV